MGTVDDTPVRSTFYWGWRDGMTATSLSECGTYGISVVPQSGSSPLGVPPYYMIAWKANGVPTVSNIGSDTANLNWQVNQASGSSLVLTVADSRGLPGGIDPYIYSVVDSNGTTGCLPSSPSTSITLSSNVSTSETLQTCEPLELQVKGGEKPYTVSVAALNSVLVVNMTLGDDDTLTWPNQASPNAQLIVSVSDANGVWGTSTGIYNTAGANDTSCALKATSRTSGDASESSGSSSGGGSSGGKQDGSGSSGSNSHTVLIAAVVGSVVFVSILAALAFFFLRRRRRRLRRADGPQPAIVPDAWLGPSTFIATNRDSATGTSSSKSYQRLARSDDLLLEPKRLVQHADAGDIHELPPPYRDRGAEASTSSLNTR